MRIYLDEVKKYYSWVFIFKYAMLLTSALFIIDILNFPTKFLLAYDMKITVILIMLVFLFFILTAVEFHFFDAFKIVSINIIDAIYLVILLSSILYSSISLIYASLSPYKIVSLILMLIIVIELIRIRSGGIKKAIETVGEYKSNVIDLKDIYNGKFSMIEGQPIMLGEKEVDYDCNR
ncbi:hypothetical protein [Metasolibacillus sp.]|uniref:hypothetical protein n=1 Tax=Metasolibacillus sp. TaxID=2703680 RepID=UPI0025D22D6B|nr:hypothetical protein [Metasolibacillus sp.]MCT6926095.1 hypothetical protein [Metasolibacillus sp.]MCT6942274.1 hypothetical protein [Metasolibacillus sp.]